MLCACSRLDLVCIDRKTGDYPIKVFTVEIGIRRPLGVGAGSIAVLATMPDDDALAALDALQGTLQAYSGALRRGIVPAMRAARKAGYAVSDGLVLPNVRGAGVAFRDPRGVAIGSWALPRSRTVRATSALPNSPRCCCASRRGSSARCASIWPRARAAGHAGEGKDTAENAYGSRVDRTLWRFLSNLIVNSATDRTFGANGIESRL